jgi:hypothetical protein
MAGEGFGWSETVSGNKMAGQERPDIVSGFFLRMAIFSAEIIYFHFCQVIPSTGLE